MAVVLLTRSITSAVYDTSYLPNGFIQEYCNMETFQPRCTHGDVIAMRSATFGRMQVGRCITSEAIKPFKLQQLDSDILGCSVDVLGYFDRICSGKSACDVLVPNPDLYNYRPCSSLLTMYLEASYICVSVIDEDRSCSVAAVVGSLVYAPSSQRTQQNSQSPAGSRCGSKLNPWMVEAQTGQKINISLLDFGSQQTPRRDDTNQSATINTESRRTNECLFQYGYILDKAAPTTSERNISICASNDGSTRDRFVYQSKGSAVEIVLTSMQADQGSNQHKFLLGFEAVGCSNLVPPTDAWLRRTDNEATVGCYMTRQRWHLQCQGGQWRGALGRCADSDIGREDSTSRIITAEELKLDNKAFVNTLALIAVSFIGLAVCLVIIFIGIGCSRRYQGQLNSTKIGQHSSIPCQQLRTSNAGEKQIYDNTGTRSKDGRHQYFVLDRDLVDGNMQQVSA